VIEASAEAQRLVLVAKHFHLDPYRVWHLGTAPRRHPRPRVYRDFLYAAALWLEEREVEQSMYSAMGTLNQAFGGEDPKKRARRRRRRRR
jgi:hypothetical protein